MCGSSNRGRVGCTGRGEGLDRGIWRWLSIYSSICYSPRVCLCKLRPTLSFLVKWLGSLPFVPFSWPPCSGLSGRPRDGRASSFSLLPHSGVRHRCQRLFSPTVHSCRQAPIFAFSGRSSGATFFPLPHSERPGGNTEKKLSSDLGFYLPLSVCRWAATGLVCLNSVFLGFSLLPFLNFLIFLIFASCGSVKGRPDSTVSTAGKESRLAAVVEHGLSVC